MTGTMHPLAAAAARLSSALLNLDSAWETTMDEIDDDAEREALHQALCAGYPLGGSVDELAASTGVWAEELAEILTRQPATAAALQVSVATTSTRHFEWTAVGATPEAARAALMAGWAEHCRQNPQADPAYLTEDSINVVTGPLGQAWRDYSPLLS